MTLPSNRSLLFLSDDDVSGLRVSPSRLRRVLAEAFGLHGRGRSVVDPKRSLSAEPGRFFQSMSALSPEQGHAATKWVGVATGNAARGLPTVSSLVVLSDAETGVPTAVLSADTLTVLRTAAMSALAAEHLARPDSASLGFVGCGSQAHGHLAAMLDLMPHLRTVLCVSGGSASAERLASAAREFGVRARVSGDPRDALGCDLVVTSVRSTPGLAPFLHARDVRPGAFVSAVDVGAPWHSDDFGAFDIVATDDRQQASEPSTASRLRFPRRFHADLSELAAGTAPGRRTTAERALFLFPGFALADLAVAAELVAVARESGIGISLPL